MPREEVTRGAGRQAGRQGVMPGGTTNTLQPPAPLPLEQVAGPGQPAGDFIVAGPRQHGTAGVVSLYGIESPGLTSALPLARLAVERLKEEPA